jgi:CHAD domain-containing protein
MYKKLHRAKLPALAVECVASLSGHDGPDEPFVDWAKTRLHDMTRTFFVHAKAAAADGKDLDALHRFRVQAKWLRYGMELLAPAFSEDFRDVLVPDIEKLQGRLGTINDRRDAILRLEKQLVEATPVEVTPLKKLLSAERACLRRAQSAYRSFWTLKHQAILRSELLAKTDSR